MEFNQLLKTQKIVVFDGGMGSLLAGRGCRPGGESNLESPEAVLAIHREYADAGADILITNTFTMNRINIESHGLKIDVEDVNMAGVSLARRGAGKERLVFGDIGPTGQLLEPYGSYTEEQFVENYREQAGILAGAGVDGIIIETFTDLREAKCALKACRQETDLPLVLSLAYTTTGKGGRTVMGSSAGDAANAAEKYGAAAVGANCGDLDPLAMASIVEIYRQVTSLPLIVQPNAGIPKLIDGETRYNMVPEDYAEGVMKCIENGAVLVGGCCGTTPDHLKAVVAILKRDV